MLGLPLPQLLVAATERSRDGMTSWKETGSSQHTPQPSQKEGDYRTEAKRGKMCREQRVHLFKKNGFIKLRLRIYSFDYIVHECVLFLILTSCLCLRNNVC